jgi:hypothetical protein
MEIARLFPVASVSMSARRFSQVVVRAGDRITHHLMAGLQEEGEFLEHGGVRCRLQVGFLDHRAPYDVACINRLNLGG